MTPMNTNEDNAVYTTDAPLMKHCDKVLHNTQKEVT